LYNYYYYNTDKKDKDLDKNGQNIYQIFFVLFGLKKYYNTNNVDFLCSLFNELKKNSHYDLGYDFLKP